MPTDMKLAHTPGPWRVHQHEHIGGELWLSIGSFTHDGAATDDGRWVGPVAELKYLIARDDEQLANAHLIAAAPYLLTACRAAEDYMKRMVNAPMGTQLALRREALAALRTAIAKAEGAK